VTGKGGVGPRRISDRGRDLRDLTKKKTNKKAETNEGRVTPNKLPEIGGGTKTFVRKRYLGRGAIR